MNLSVLFFALRPSTVVILHMISLKSIDWWLIENYYYLYIFASISRKKLFTHFIKYCNNLMQYRPSTYEIFNDYYLMAFLHSKIYYEMTMKYATIFFLNRCATHLLKLFHLIWKNGPINKRNLNQQLVTKSNLRLNFTKIGFF